MRYTSKQFLVDDIIFQHDRLRAELNSLAPADWEVCGVYRFSLKILARWRRRCELREKMFYTRL